MDIKIVNNSFPDVRTIGVHRDAQNRCTLPEFQAHQGFQAFPWRFTAYTLAAILLTKMARNMMPTRSVSKKSFDR